VSARSSHVEDETEPVVAAFHPVETGVELVWSA
jgi:hypothetical protein